MNGGRRFSKKPHNSKHFKRSLEDYRPRNIYNSTSATTLGELFNCTVCKRAVVRLAYTAKTATKKPCFYRELYFLVPFPPCRFPLSFTFLRCNYGALRTLGALV